MNTTEDKVRFSSPMSCGRPVRLSLATRQFAKDSLDGVWGREALLHPYVTVEYDKNAPPVTERDRYDLAVTAIAENAPLRRVKGELLVGSATLGGAISHVVPATLDGENPVCGSISHLTCNFMRVVREGMDATGERIQTRLSDASLSEQERRVAESQWNAFCALKTYHRRYLDLLREEIKTGACDISQELYENLLRVPFAPAKTFREAVQSVWFTFSFLRLMGNWPGIGRLDMMLSPLYEKDIREGRITEEDARELLAHFFIKGCEWVNLQSRGSGDAQHYQNIVLGGVDEDGIDRTSDVTRLILEVVEELPISDYPIAVRVGENAPKWLLPKMAEVIRHGSGVVAMYNEELIIDSLVRFGYPLREARQFANDGCWEVQIPGKTRFGYSPMDLYSVLENDVLHVNDNSDIPDYPDFESLYAKFREGMNRVLDGWHSATDHSFFDSSSAVVDLFEDGCVERSRSYYNGGPIYNVSSPHFGGIPDTANAMYAIQRAVYEEKRLTLTELVRILRANWEGEEILRQEMRTRYTYYGNDNDTVDFLVARIVRDFVTDSRRVTNREGILRPPGISTFGRQIEWKDVRGASAHGFRRGEILAGNISPTPTTDRAGATAIIRSACKTDFSDLTCGTVLDIKLDPKSVAGEDGITAISGLLDGFRTLGGFFIQIDVIDNAVLLEAQKHPEAYSSLAVRISGWSARFVTLDENWQKMVIERTAQGIG